MKITKSFIDAIIFFCMACIIFGGSSKIADYRYLFVVVSVIALIAKQILKNGTIIKINLKNKIMILMLIFTFYIIMSLFYTYSFDNTARFIFFFVLCIIIILINHNDVEFWTNFQKIMLNVSVFLAVTILISTVNKGFVPKYFGFLMPSSEEGIRVYYAELEQGIFSGISFERAYAAFNLNIGIGIIMAKFFTYSKMKKSDIVKIIILLIALFCTGKRALLLIDLIAFVALGIYNKRSSMIKKYIKLLPVAIILSIVVLLCVPSASKVFERLFDNDVDTMDIRREAYWEYAMEMFFNKPLQGYGIATFKSYIMQFRSENIYNAHNIYIQALGEIGILGSLNLILIYVVAYTHNIKNIKKERDMKKKCILNYSIYIQTLFLIYGLTGNTLYYSSQLFIYIIAICMNIDLSRINKGETKNEKDRNNYIS